jgi:hypothetical protein
VRDEDNIFLCLHSHFIPDESSLDPGEESNREKRSVFDSVDHSDDDIDFESVADMTDMSNLHSPGVVASPPDLQDLYQRLRQIRVWRNSCGNQV